MLDWLQENVGPLLWSNPILEWHGQGWSMRTGTDFNPGPEINFIKVYQDVTIYDAQKELIFRLIWT